jgi:hypothetical protein
MGSRLFRQSCPKGAKIKMVQQGNIALVGILDVSLNGVIIIWEYIQILIYIIELLLLLRIIITTIINHY